MSSPNESTAVFECENPERALVLLHKIGRDVSQSATVKAEWRKNQSGSIEVPVLVRPGTRELPSRRQGQESPRLHKSEDRRS